MVGIEFGFGARYAFLANANQQTIVIDGEKVLVVELEALDILDDGVVGDVPRLHEGVFEGRLGVDTGGDDGGHERHGGERAVGANRALHWLMDSCSSA